MLEGMYTDDDQPLSITCGMKRGQKKHFKRNKKEYKRLSEHIGLIPIVIISPADTYLIEGGSEERRRLMDVVIAQTDHTYIDALSRYNKALQGVSRSAAASESLFRIGIDCGQSLSHLPHFTQSEALVASCRRMDAR